MATIAREGTAADRLEAALLNLSRGSFADPDDVLRHALAEGARSLCVARVAAWNLDRTDSSRLVLRAVHSADHNTAGDPTVAPLTPGPADTWPRTWITTPTASGTSGLSASFWRSGAPTGVLHFESTDPDRHWTDAERLFAAAIAEHIAAALDRIEKDRIHHADVRLHSAYAELEKRVAFRTVQLEQAKETAEQANRAKSEFLSRMSHELRTPMNSILGFAQVLARSDLSPQDGRSVQHVLRAGRHLLQLINEVLDIARIESGRHALSLEPVRVDTVIQEACGMVRPLSTQWSVHLEVSSIPCADMFVRADRQRLAQVLLNLLSNAIKYNRRDGTVRLRCAREASTVDGNDHLVIRVQDNGYGIPADRVDQLFSPFNRLGAEQSEIEGTGLGLALSQRLTEAMGGTLALESTGPNGSVFRIDLDIAHGATERSDDGIDTPTIVADDTHGPAMLLYIEENLANLSLVETILLSRPKWRTLPALQGRIGLELAREHAPDLILLDLHLPDIHGAEVLRRLRLDDSTAHIPVVVISADATPSTVERMLGAGAAAFIPKPLDIDEFLETIERLLPAAATGR